MLDVMFDAPSRDDIHSVTLDRDAVKGLKPAQLSSKTDKAEPEKDAA